MFHLTSKNVINAHNFMNIDTDTNDKNSLNNSKILETMINSSVVVDSDDEEPESS